MFILSFARNLLGACFFGPFLRDSFFRRIFVLGPFVLVPICPGAHLFGTHLSWCRFVWDFCPRAHLSWCHLFGAHLSENNLSGAHLSGDHSSKNLVSQDTRVLKTLVVISPKTSNTCWTCKATERIKLERAQSYYNNPTHSNNWHLFTPLLNSVILHGVVTTTFFSSTKPIRNRHSKRMGTDCLRPSSPSDNLPVAEGIKPVDLQRKRASIALVSWAKEPNHLLHDRFHYIALSINKDILN